MSATTNKTYPLSNVSSPRGAPMGRCDTLPRDTQEKVLLSLVRLRWVDGDYDAGGAYWGHSREHGDMWRAVGDASDCVVEVFVRARSRREARDAVSECLPSAVFYR